MVFSSTAPVSAAAQLGNALEGMMDYLDNDKIQAITKHLNEFKIEKADNNNELSKDNKKIISKTLKNFKENLLYADIKNSETIILLITEKEDTQVAITNNIVEVLERIDENIFLINGEENHFEVSVSEEIDNQELTDNVLNDVTIQANDGWIQVGSRSGPWTFESGKWVNVNASRDFVTYTASALASVLTGFMGIALGLSFGSTLVLGISVAAAYNYTATANYPTNVGKSYVSYYRNGPIPLSDRRVWSSDYAIHNGTDYHLGISETFYTPCVGCGV